MLPTRTRRLALPDGIAEPGAQCVRGEGATSRPNRPAASHENPAADPLPGATPIALWRFTQQEPAEIFREDSCVYSQDPVTSVCHAAHRRVTRVCRLRNATGARSDRSGACTTPAAHRRQYAEESGSGVMASPGARPPRSSYDAIVDRTSSGTERRRGRLRAGPAMPAC